MSILHDETQQEIAAETARVLGARRDKARLLEVLDRCGEWDEGFWRTAVEQGWTGLAVPEDFDGLGLGLTELGLVAQEAGRVISGAPFLTYGHGAVCALLACGDEALQDAWLPRLAQGEVRAAIAFAEGTDPIPLCPQVEYRDGGLHGEKAGVAGALAADIAVVSASRDGTPVLVLADLNAAVSGQLERTAIHSIDNGRLFANLGFHGLPATVLAEGDAARDLALEMQAQMAVLAAHEQTGGAEALMLAARDYAVERKAFGQPIGAFQSVKHRIAELYGLVEIARANCIHAASLQGQAGFLEAAACARLSATEAYDTAARDAVQIHGGTGVTWEGALHLHTRRARSLAIELGNGLFWEDVLVTGLTGVAA
ncbi:acyl-CoA dehydrogenase family protein [Novosphingobium album (ex Hu et al. 2023)]|uniref:Acyl-CoA/acyl-ACP dehydrogenase n=1 Tax=Novosphingobium album (ex Hu et al. 2023) TaxID=2930093 RepID=A0ABT0B3Q7_9SPHN|nr:acyl-CoA dehydrogenase family protein [Novosphingobium album (ex Hu et al. 2023)]MCJ2179535.1 acyl-CoA/acyl-ACP dehydrogenase [Novosphingobium album (ex Hu et al. 2023)]